MNKKHFILLIVIAVLMSSFYFSTHGGAKVGHDQEDLDELWLDVSRYEASGKYRSAMAVSKRIFLLSDRDGRYEHNVKALLHLFKYSDKIDRHAYKNLLGFAEEMISDYAVTASFQHAVIARLYHQYFMDHQWEILDMEDAEDIHPGEIENWTLSDYRDTILYHFKESLSLPEELSAYSVPEQSDLFTKSNLSEPTRTNMLEFLGHLALDYLLQVNNVLRNDAMIKKANPYKIWKDFENISIDDYQWPEDFKLAFQIMKAMQPVCSKSMASSIDLGLKKLEFISLVAGGPGMDDFLLSSYEDLYQSYSSSLASLLLYKMANIYDRKADYYDPYQEDRMVYRFERKRALEICREAMQKYPGSRGADKCKQLSRTIEKQIIYHQTAHANPGKERIPVKIEYKNTERLLVEVYELNTKEWQSIPDYSKEEFYEYIRNKGEKVQKHELILPGEKDYQRHSTEFLLDPLPKGLYAIIVFPRGHEKVFSYSSMWVSDLSYIKPQFTGRNEKIIILDRKSGNYVPGAKCTIWSVEYNRKGHRDYKQLGEYKSNEFGEVEINYSDLGRKAYLPEISYKKDVFVSSENLYPGYIRTHNKQARDRLYLFTDRKVYRPGQILYFKGILKRLFQDSIYLPEHEKISVELRDANGKTVSSGVFVSNEFGSFHGQFHLPETGLNGSFSLISAKGSTRFKVENYKRPSFKIVFEKGTEAQVPGDTVFVRGRARYYNGEALSRASVEYEIQRKHLNFPYRYPGNRDAVLIDRGRFVTDEEGGFEIAFKTTDSTKQALYPVRGFVYETSVDISDAKGETQSKTYSRAISGKAFSFQANIPKIYSPEESGDILIKALSPDGYSLNVKAKVFIYRLKEPKELLIQRQWQYPDVPYFTASEWKKLHPGHEYRDESEIRNFPIDKAVGKLEINLPVDSLFNLQAFDFKQTGAYRIVIESADYDVKLVKEFTVAAIKSQRMPYLMPDWMTVQKTPDDLFIRLATPEKQNQLLWIESKRQSMEMMRIKTSGKIKTIRIPIREEYQGGFYIHRVFVKDNRFYYEKKRIDVDYPQDDIRLEWITERKNLEPGKEESLKLKISREKFELSDCELAVWMYDKSLEQFGKYPFQRSFLPQFYSSLDIPGRAFSVSHSHFTPAYQSHLAVEEIVWKGLNDYDLFRFRRPYYREMPVFAAARGLKKTGLAEHTEMDEAISGKEQAVNMLEEKDVSSDLNQQIIRSDFKETAFFYPQLYPDKDGCVKINFKVPDALTEWKVNILCHAKDMAVKSKETLLVSKKELMLMPNMPRFLREKDSILIKVNLLKLDKQIDQVSFEYQFTDAISKQVILESDEALGFSFDDKQQVVAGISMTVPQGVSLIKYRILAKGRHHTDAMEGYLPVLSSRIEVTESKAFHLRNDDQYVLDLSDWNRKYQDKEMISRRLLFEYTSNPIWYVVNAIPALYQGDNRSNLKLSNDLFVLSRVQKMLEVHPEIRDQIMQWQKSGELDDFLTGLNSKKDLREMLIRETPWLMDAENAVFRKQSLLQLMDQNFINYQLLSIYDLLEKRQKSDGAWSWFESFRSDLRISMSIAENLIRSRNLKGKIPGNAMIGKALEYMDEEMLGIYEKSQNRRVKSKYDSINYFSIQYIYLRSLCPEYSLQEKYQEAFSYYNQMLDVYCFNQSLEEQVKIALAKYHQDNRKQYQRIKSAFKDNVIKTERSGYAWKSDKRFSGGHRDIKLQAKLLELFRLEAEDASFITEMETWLILQKRVRDWGDHPGTMEAVSALTDYRETTDVPMEDQIQIPKETEASCIMDVPGFGYKQYELKSMPGEGQPLTIEKKGDGASWGSLFWQYSIPMEKLESSGSGFSIRKEFYIYDDGKYRKAGLGQALKIGDKIMVKIRIDSEHDFDYFHIRDYRPCSGEPYRFSSGRVYQGKLWAYQQLNDASVDFYLDHIDQGVHYLSYEMVVSHAGKFSSGYIYGESVYAPELRSYGKGGSIKIEDY